MLEVEKTRRETAGVVSVTKEDFARKNCRIYQNYAPAYVANLLKDNAPECLRYLWKMWNVIQMCYTKLWLDSNYNQCSLFSGRFTYLLAIELREFCFMAEKAILQKKYLSLITHGRNLHWWREHLKTISMYIVTTATYSLLNRNN